MNPSQQLEQALLESTRLKLVPIDATAHAQDMFEYAQHPDVGPRAGWPVHTSVEETISVIDNFLSKPFTTPRAPHQLYYNSTMNNTNAPVFALIYKENNKMIGTVGAKDLFFVQRALNWDVLDENLAAQVQLQKDQNPDTTQFDINACEIGYCLNPAYWGKGLVLEAVVVLLKYVIEVLKIQTILITPKATNQQSIRVCEKLQCVLKDTAVGALQNADGTATDILIFCVDVDAPLFQKA